MFLGKGVLNPLFSFFMRINYMKGGFNVLNFNGLNFNGLNFNGQKLVNLIFKKKEFLILIFANLITQLGITYYVMQKTEKNH